MSSKHESRSGPTIEDVPGMVSEVATVPVEGGGGFVAMGRLDHAGTIMTCAGAAVLADMIKGALRAIAKS